MADNGASAKRQRRPHPFPANTLEEALAVPQAIRDGNSGQPLDRILLAQVLESTPKSSAFVRTLNSSERYGLTVGGASSARITLTPVGRAVVAPTTPEERRRALVKAACMPEVFGAFYQRFEGQKVPEDEFARNLLVQQMGVHPKFSDECLGIVLANGRFVDILREVGGSWYVRHFGPEPSEAQDVEDQQSGRALVVGTDPARRPAGKVLVAHMGRPDAAKYVASLLAEFGVAHSATDCAVEGARPVPESVAEAMHGCSSAVLIVTPDGTDGHENGAMPKVPHRIVHHVGAASVLYGQRFIILKENGLDLEGYADGVPIVGYEPGRLAEAAGPLMVALHKAGVVRVSG
jgi:hypothetical protein